MWVISPWVITHLPDLQCPKYKPRTSICLAPGKKHENMSSSEIDFPLQPTRENSTNLFISVNGSGPKLMLPPHHHTLPRSSRDPILVYFRGTQTPRKGSWLGDLAALLPPHRRSPEAKPRLWPPLLPAAAALVATSVPGRRRPARPSPPPREGGRGGGGVWGPWRKKCRAILFACFFFEGECWRLLIWGWCVCELVLVVCFVRSIVFRKGCGDCSLFIALDKCPHFVCFRTTSEKKERRIWICAFCLSWRWPCFA